MSNPRLRPRLLPLFFALSLSACGPAPLTAGPQPSGTPVPALSPTPVATPSAQPDPSVSPDATPAPSVTPAATPTPPVSPVPSITAAPTAPAPAAPTGLQVVEQSQTSLTLQWDFPADARSFKLYLDGKEVAANHVTPNYYRFEGLRVATSYRLGVQSINAGGSSEIISISTATTSSGHSASGNFSSGGNGNTASSRREGFSRQEPAAFLLDRGTPPDKVVVIPDVDLNASGESVVVWLRVRGEAGSIMAQRFDAKGRSEGDPVVVTEVGSSPSFSAPQVSLDNDGNFVVSYSQLEDGGDQQEVFYRYYPASGRPREAVRVNQDTSGNQTAAGVSINPRSGDFAVAWVSETGTDDVMLQRYEADGSPTEAALTLNSEPFEVEYSQTLTSLAQDDDGNLAVVWAGMPSTGGTSSDIWLRRVMADGSLPNPEFVVNETTDDAQNEPAVAMNGDGEMVVSWSSLQAEDPDRGIFARQFDAAGDAGSEFMVNEETAGSQSTSYAGVRPNGRFVISWVSSTLESFPVDSLYRSFSAGGSPGEVVQINDYEAVSVVPKIAVNADQLAVAWFLIDTAPDADPDDPPTFSVYTRRF